MGNASERRFSFPLSLDLGYSVFDLGYSAGSFPWFVSCQHSTRLGGSVSSAASAPLREILPPPVNGYCFSSMALDEIDSAANAAQHTQTRYHSRPGWLGNFASLQQAIDSVPRAIQKGESSSSEVASTTSPSAWTTRSSRCWERTEEDSHCLGDQRPAAPPGSAQGRHRHRRRQSSRLQRHHHRQTSREGDISRVKFSEESKRKADTHLLWGSGERPIVLVGGTGQRSDRP